MGEKITTKYLLDLVSRSFALAIPLLDKNKKIKVDTTEELKETVLSELENTDILFMAAAPLDFKPAKTFDKKVKKQNINNIELIQNEDILALTKDKKLKNNKNIVIILKDCQ